ncbi:MAG TPA: type 1 glutamine amidotransferase domain-containing protein [Bryobacteraceae bacterium]|nr:type 1 glutamine amidotransferase domain-containing protein [Bryobacteraceae bacterium]
MNNKPTILVIASSADSLTLKDGRKEHAGYYLNELDVPVQAALDAGYQMVLATPNGNKPVMDPQSNVAAHFGGSEVALQKALDFINTYPAVQNPRSFRSVIEEGLDRYVGFYIPGGHPPMIDLMQDPNLGEILRHAHFTSKPTALLCHGPVAIAAAMPKAKEFRAALVEGQTEKAKKLAAGWQYAGYRMTVFSNDEEHYAEEHLMGGGKVPFYVNDALKIAGGDVSISDKGIFRPLVIEDRELITGQNPPSDHEMGERFVKALDRATSKAA